MSWLLTEQGKLFYRSNADSLEKNPFLILIHGAGGDSRIWNALFPLLKEDISLIIPDLPGHGKSEGIPAERLDGYFEAIELLSEEFKLNKFYIGGHSMGGAISLLYAAAHSERVMGTIVIASSSSLPVNPMIFQLVKENFPMMVKTSLQFSFEREDEDVKFYRGLTEEMLKKNGPDVLYKDMKACNEYSIKEKVSEINSPVLIIAGERDKLVPYDNVTDFYSRLTTKKELLTIERCGHMIPFEAPEESSKTVISFVKSLSA